MKILCKLFGHTWKRRVFFSYWGCDDDAPAPVEFYCTRCRTVKTR